MPFCHVVQVICDCCPLEFSACYLLPYGHLSEQLLRISSNIVSLFCQTGDSRFESRECVHYTKDQLLQLREVCQNIHLLKALLSMLASQSQSRYLEPESRDWRGRSGQSTSFGDERSWDTIRENKESNNLNSGHQEIRQLNKQGSQFSSNTQVSSIQAVIY
ncbi:hypothetical protein B296_00018282 [Ensete ventricosum]|uniref:Uncharacterized protein n=1 Tax=Ensete ventricosum TaxID=4639 RepID=A0A426Z5V3_ENSVE|nr:hypothetical protein B296_00018282 [Ensete ventricosum]